MTLFWLLQIYSWTNTILNTIDSLVTQTCIILNKIFCFILDLLISISDILLLHDLSYFTANYSITVEVIPSTITITLVVRDIAAKPSIALHLDLCEILRAMVSRTPRKVLESGSSEMNSNTERGVGANRNKEPVHAGMSVSSSGTIF